MKKTDIKTLADLLIYCKEAYGNRTAFCEKTEDGTLNTLTYRALHDKCRFISSKLSSSYCARIALLGENSLSLVVALFSVLYGGGTAVMIDRELPEAEIASLIKRSDCNAVLYSESCGGKALGIKSLLPDMLFLSLDEFCQNGTSTPPYKKSLPDENNTAVVVFTSGTTGESKGVKLTHRNIISDALCACERVGEINKTVLALPLHHSFALTAATVCVMLKGASTYISSSVRHLQRDSLFFKPDALIVVPVIIEEAHKRIAVLGVSDEQKRAALFGGNINTIVCGGAWLDSKTASFYHSLGVDIRIGYGITECSPIVSVSGKAALPNDFTSVGVPLSCCTVKIDSPDENGCGEILVKGSNVTDGYIDGEADAAFEGEWFKTGDIGKIDTGGELHITGRKKNLIILSNGKNISAEEIEQNLRQSPAVEEVAVFESEGKICAEIHSLLGKSDVYAAVDNYNRTAAHCKNVEKIIIRTTPFEKTSTMKIKRTNFKGGQTNGREA